MSELSNRYQPPAAELEGSASPATLVPAGSGRRFGTFVVDYLCVYVFAFLIGLVMALTGSQAALAAFTEASGALFGVAVMVIYYVFFEAMWSRTPGKMVFGTKVVNETGGKPSIGQTFGRTLCRFIPLEPFSCFRERGWHDTIPKTIVVRSRTA